MASLSLHAAGLAFALCVASCSSGDAPGGDSTRLQVDDQRWPVRVLELAQTTIHMVAERGEPAYLTEINVQLPDVGTPAPVTAVSYQFYLPGARKGLAVTWANTDITISADQQEAMRRAGVEDMMKASIEATFAPRFTELPPPSHGYVPTPLFGVQVGMQDAYQLARRAGLTRAHSIDLKVGTKDPTVPLLIWTFRGDHSLADSKAVNIDALTGELIDEDRINATTRAERDAQFAADQAMIRAFFSRGRGGDGWSAPALTPEAAAIIDGGGRQQEHGIYFDGLRDYTVGPAADCVARGGNDAGPSSMGGSFCY